MKILLTGANGYIGKRLLPLLIAEGHDVLCCVRNKSRFKDNQVFLHERITLLEVDFLNPPEQPTTESGIDAAYYLIHSMSDNDADFEALEAAAARNFLAWIAPAAVRQIIYLGGITNEVQLSKHLSSRRQVDTILREGPTPVTTLKAGIIVGSGSASFEIIRDLVEKLPIMVTPKWLNTRIQPIAVRNVLAFLTGVLLRQETFGKSYDIAGPDILTYKQMLLQFAEVRGLRRYIYTIPVMTPRLSSYWLYFVTSTSYKLAVHLVNSMQVEVVASQNDLSEMLGIEPLSYKKAVELAFQKIEQNNVASSWKDALISSSNDPFILQQISVPTHGCFIDKRSQVIPENPEQVLANIWAIGGKRGWYYGNWLWTIRGYLDKLFGGVGLRRGRTNATDIYAGDTLDFWRVLIANRQQQRLLLYAEMKLPGEAWLEFHIKDENGKSTLFQTATFRPKGLLGRLYWFAVLPFHHFIFNGMLTRLIRFRNT